MEFESRQQPGGDSAAEEIPADAEESVYTSGDSGEDAAWQRFIEQLKTRGPAHTRYAFKGEVAHGGMGVIHRVYDQDFRRHLAMKIILGTGGTGGQGSAQAVGGAPNVDSRSLGRFLEEAQVTGQLDHPGIVPAHELGVDAEENVYFTMKLVKGEDLRSVFERVHDPNDDDWNPTRALSLLLRVCEAMAYAHSKGVIHRDLKPSNIMVGKYGETYVMDWGLARVLGKKDRKDLRIQPTPLAASTPIKSHRRDASGASPDSPLITMDGDVVGTPAYMSPEQARGELDRIGPQSDVYALGTLLYHLLAGHMPYVQPGICANQHAIWRWVQEGPPIPLSRAARGAPAELTAICEKAMSRTLADRYADMEELALDLRAFLENRVVAAYESGAVAELKHWVKRNRGVTATAAAAAVIITLLTGWFVVKVQSEKNSAVVERDRADRNADLAVQRAEEAEAQKQRVLRLSDIKALSDLKAQMADLWPAHPKNVLAMEQWLQNAQKVTGNLAAHQQTLADLRSRGTPATHPQDGELADLKNQAVALAARLDATDTAVLQAELRESVSALQERIESLAATIRREQPHVFADEQDAWWHNTLVSLVSGLVAFAEDDPFGQTVASVKARKEFAQAIRKNSITYYQAEWDEAIKSIADPDECPLYGGLELREQLGLVPIGRDPDSGLWEFWHVQSGARSPRDENERLVLTEAMGLVFVLIPGGTFWMGAQATERSGRNFDPQAESDESHEGSPVEVTLDPYFLSKYELTQGQWLRCMGSNPSDYGPGIKFGDHAATLLHPVEQVSWEDCLELLGRLGLSLPTEAQWEYGCRAGTQTPWWTGTERAELDQVGNLADQFCKANGGAASWRYEPDLNDGFVVHAPVGRYRANAFGVHDVIGNIFEWCLDDYGGYANVPKSGDGRRAVAGAAYRVLRGGSFSQLAAYARSADRDITPPGDRSSNLGARPARAVMAEDL